MDNDAGERARLRAAGPPAARRVQAAVATPPPTDDKSGWLAAPDVADPAAAQALGIAAARPPRIARPVAAEAAPRPAEPPRPVQNIETVQVDQQEQFFEANEAQLDDLSRDLSNLATSGRDLAALAYGDQYDEEGEEEDEDEPEDDADGGEEEGGSGYDEEDLGDPEDVDGGPAGDDPDALDHPDEDGAETSASGATVAPAPVKGLTSFAVSTMLTQFEQLGRVEGIDRLVAQLKATSMSVLGEVARDPGLTERARRIAGFIPDHGFLGLEDAIVAVMGWSAPVVSEAGAVTGDASAEEIDEDAAGVSEEGDGDEVPAFDPEGALGDDIALGDDGGDEAEGGSDAEHGRDDQQNDHEDETDEDEADEADEADEEAGDLDARIGAAVMAIQEGDRTKPSVAAQPAATSQDVGENRGGPAPAVKPAANAPAASRPRQAWIAPFVELLPNIPSNPNAVRFFEEMPMVAMGIVNMIAHTKPSELERRSEYVTSQFKLAAQVAAGDGLDARTRDGVLAALLACETNGLEQIEVDRGLAERQIRNRAVFVLAGGEFLRWLSALETAVGDSFSDATTNEDAGRLRDVAKWVELSQAVLGYEALRPFSEKVVAAVQKRLDTISQNRSASLDDAARGRAFFKAAALQGPTALEFQNFVSSARSFLETERIVVRESTARRKAQDQHGLYDVVIALRAAAFDRARQLQQGSRAEGIAPSALKEMLAGQGEGIYEAFVRFCESQDLVRREAEAARSNAEIVAALRDERNAAVGERDNLVSQVAAAREMVANARSEDSVQVALEHFRDTLEGRSVAGVHRLQGGSPVVELPGPGGPQIMIDTAERQVALFFMHGQGARDWMLRDGTLAFSEKVGTTVDLKALRTYVRESGMCDRNRPLVIRVMVCHGGLNGGGDILFAFDGFEHRMAGILGSSTSDAAIEA